MKHLGELLVADCMNPALVSVEASEKLTVAIRKMDSQRLSVLPVVDDRGELTGILSTSDLIEIIHEVQSDLTALNHVTAKTQQFLISLLMEQGDDTRVSDVMTSPVETTHPETNLVVAARKLVELHYHHLPVVDHSGSTVGMLSTSDIAQAVAEYGALAAG